MSNYGYTTDKTKLPKNNYWVAGNELTLKDDSIVYGYEGEDSEVGGVVVMTKKDFNAWAKENLKQEEFHA